MRYCMRLYHWNKAWRSNEERELEMLKRKFAIGIMALGVMLAPVNTFAQSAHISEAIKELREGISEGRKGMASSFAEHMCRIPDDCSVF